MFQKATRKKAKLRLALVGPSGSGKTMSALLLAMGLGGRIALLDTERGSGDLYADVTEYDTQQLEPPFTPQKYIDAIKAAEAGGYNVLIIDSLSHAWAGEGGVLDIHETISRGTRSGNSYTAWREANPHHEAIVNAILGSKLHVIVTLRTKTAYEIVEDERGKKTPKRIGLAPVQRQGLEYEFTCVVDLSMDTHYATASKDRSRVFGSQCVGELKPEHGAALRAWLDSGDEPAVTIDPYAELRKQITEAKTLTELSAVWQGFDADQRAAMSEAKDERKAKLTHERKKQPAAAAEGAAP